MGNILLELHENAVHISWEHLEQTGSVIVKRRRVSNRGAWSEEHIAVLRVLVKSRKYQFENVQQLNIKLILHTI